MIIKTYRLTFYYARMADKGGIREASKTCKQKVYAHCVQICFSVSCYYMAKLTPT